MKLILDCYINSIKLLKTGHKIVAVRANRACSAKRRIWIVKDKITCGSKLGNFENKSVENKQAKD